MLYDRIELFNVAETVALPGRPGVLLQRVPERVRDGLREGARGVVRKAAGMELRMVSEGWEPAEVELACFDGVGQAYVYFGDYYVKQAAIGPEPVKIRLEAGPPGFFPRVTELLPPSPFAPQVWRVVLHGGEMHLLGVEGSRLRPPAAHETPARKLLAYGTSISQGIAALTPDLSYVSQVAWRLGIDALNLATAGAAFCEPAMADYIAERGDWNLATLCVSVNMLNQGVTAEEFRDKAAYLVNTIASRHPSKPIVCIGLFPFFGDLGLIWPERHPQASSAQYREALRSVVREAGRDHVHYVDGPQLLTRFDGLTHDLLHPGNRGMIEIGERLAALLKPLLEQQGR